MVKGVWGGRREESGDSIYIYVLVGILYGGFRGVKEASRGALDICKVVPHICLLAFMFLA